MVKNVRAFGIFFIEDFRVSVSDNMNQLLFCYDSGRKDSRNFIFVKVFVGNKSYFKVRRLAFVFLADFAPEVSGALGKFS